MSSPSEHQNHQKLQQEHQLQNERQQRQQFQQQQQYLLNFFAAQGAALRNNLCMPNMFPFNWPMTATATVTASPSAAATVTDLPSWNPYMPYLQNGTQVHQESFEDVLKKMVQPKPSVQSSNGRASTMLNSVKHLIDGKVKTNATGGVASTESSTAGIFKPLDLPEKALEPGEIPRKRDNSKTRNGLPKVSNVSMSPELLASSFMYSMALNRYTAAAMQSENLRAIVQNAFNAEKSKMKGSSKRSTPSSNSNNSCVSRKSDQRSHEKIEPSSSQFPESPLDLSNHKMPSVEPIERCGRSNESASTSEHVLESDSSKKRTVADAALVRLPLSLGWRRQTCIRSISGTGIRGDVIYYAPTGKKLNSYNEVIRYLNKQNITEIGREHFSFSCKIIVGEFLLVKTVGNEKVISTINEREILAEIERQASGTGTKKATNINGSSYAADNLSKPHGHKNAEKINAKTPNLLPKQINQNKRDPLLEKLFVGAKSLHKTEKGKGENTTLISGIENSKKATNCNIATNSRQSPAKNSADNAKIKPKQDEEERLKTVRQPIDDLLLDETKKLPPLVRIPNLTLTGPAFGDILMVVEFVRNFAHVLQIDLETVPKLDEIVAGIQNDPKHIMSFLRLTRTLLYLVLEFPGLPSGVAGRTALGQSLKEIGVHRENFSELMKMFLLSRCEKAQKLGIKLENCSFEYLDPVSKAAILAIFCNELLSCKNVMQEIESNTEEIIRLKGEKWLREGRSRALRGVQAKKRAGLHRKASLIFFMLTMLIQEMKDASENGVGSPHSSQSYGSEERVISPPLHSTPTLKALTPGLGQCDIITKEEEEMSIDQLEEYINKLNSEAEILRDKHNALSERVRTLPLGQDRFHRYFWSVPSYGAPLVESIASGSLNNPAVNIDITCADDPPSIVDDPYHYMDPDVIACVEDILDEMCVAEEKPDKGKKVRFRRLDNKCKRGWWTITNEKQVEQFRGTLHGRGIRERVLQRVLAKDASEFAYGKQLKFSTVSRSLTKFELNQSTCSRLANKVAALEQKVLAANFCCEPSRFIDTDDVDSEDSLDGWNRDDKYIFLKRQENDDDCDLVDCEEFKHIKRRLLGLEKNIERRYLLHRYHARSWIPAELILRAQEPSYNNLDQGNSNNDTVANGSSKVNMKKIDVNEQPVSSAIVCDESGDTLLLQKWRKFVEEAKTGGQVMLAIQALDAGVAWEKSIMKVCCQICRNNENESQLLLCDSCDFGYHLYCFRPRLSAVPPGDWFCPLCVQRACGKVLCLLCGQYSQSNVIVICSKCYYGYHPICFDRPPVVADAKQWTCPGCLNVAGSSTELKNALLNNDIEMGTDQQESGENNLNGMHDVIVGRPVYGHADTSIKPKSGHKRKLPPPDYDFPPDMLNSLFMTMIDEMWRLPESEPFRYPVDPRVVPLYRKIIKNPIDLSEIRSNIETQRYDRQEKFLEDVDKIFENCRKFNEDNSEIGAAGIALHKFYTKRWKQLRYNFSKRLKRLQTKHPRSDRPHSSCEAAGPSLAL